MKHVLHGLVGLQSLCQSSRTRVGSAPVGMHLLEIDITLLHFAISWPTCTHTRIFREGSILISPIRTNLLLTLLAVSVLHGAVSLIGVFLEVEGAEVADRTHSVHVFRVSTAQKLIYRRPIIINSPKNLKLTWSYLTKSIIFAAELGNEKQSTIGVSNTLITSIANTVTLYGKSSRNSSLTLTVWHLSCHR
jgi:hypothetical protein